MIRYHSFYPWHTHGAYRYLCDDKDSEMLPWVQRFKRAAYCLFYLLNLHFLF